MPAGVITSPSLRCRLGAAYRPSSDERSVGQERARRGRLGPLPATKLQVYRPYLADLWPIACRLGKPDPAARRRSDLGHRSVPDEIEQAIRASGNELEHDWDITVPISVRPEAGTRVQEPT